MKAWHDIQYNTLIPLTSIHLQQYAVQRPASISAQSRNLHYSCTHTHTRLVHKQTHTYTHRHIFTRRFTKTYNHMRRHVHMDAHTLSHPYRQTLIHTHLRSSCHRRISGNQRYTSIRRSLGCSHRSGHTGGLGSASTHLHLRGRISIIIPL